MDLPKAGTGQPGSGSPNSGSRPGGGNGGSDFLNRPSAGTLPSQRPGTGERPTERPGQLPSERPGAENRPDRSDNRQENRGDRQDSVSDRRDDRQGSVSDRRDDRTDNRTDRRDNLSGNRADRIDNVGERKVDRHERRTEVRQQVASNPPRRDFWRDNRYAARWRWNRPYRWATWGALSTWFPWGWSQPYNYSYGDNVYVDNSTVYYGEEAIATEQEYAEQASAIAASAPPAEEIPESTEWMPLGVFALTQDGQASGPAPTMFMQLAISKEGTIAGTFVDQSSDETREIEGAIDQKTQRAAWVLSGASWPVIETGISSLAEDESPVLMHFEDGQTQQWLIVRLEDPEGQAN